MHIFLYVLQYLFADQQAQVQVIHISYNFYELIFTEKPMRCILKMCLFFTFPKIPV